MKAVNGVQEEILSLQQTMQNTIISHITDETKIFTPEQRNKFFMLMKERIEQNSRPFPPWMWTTMKTHPLER
jgi:hypothetical protein